MTPRSSLLIFKYASGKVYISGISYLTSEYSDVAFLKESIIEKKSLSAKSNLPLCNNIAPYVKGDNRTRK